MRWRLLFPTMAIIGTALALPARAGAQPATVVVENQVDRGLFVWINGDLMGVAPANGEVRFEVGPGPVSLLAGDYRGVVASEKRTLADGETFTWTLYPASGRRAAS